MAEAFEVCATCRKRRPVNTMHVETIERLVGRNYRSSSGSRQGTRRSSSYGRAGSARFNTGSSVSTSRRSGTTDRTEFVDVWVCDTCRSPHSYHSRRRLLVKWGIAGLAIWLLAPLAIAGVKLLLHDAPTRSSTRTLNPIGSDADADSSAVSGDPVVGQPDDTVPPDRSKPKPSVVFGPRREVVQPLPNPTPSSQSDPKDGGGQ